MPLQYWKKSGASKRASYQSLKILQRRTRIQSLFCICQILTTIYGSHIWCIVQIQQALNLFLVYLILNKGSSIAYHSWICASFPFGLESWRQKYLAGSPKDKDLIFLFLHLQKLISMNPRWNVIDKCERSVEGKKNDLTELYGKRG